MASLALQDAGEGADALEQAAAAAIVSPRLPRSKRRVACRRRNAAAAGSALVRLVLRPAGWASRRRVVSVGACTVGRRPVHAASAALPSSCEPCRTRTSTLLIDGFLEWLGPREWRPPSEPAHTRGASRWLGVLTAAAQCKVEGSVGPHPPGTVGRKRGSGRPPASTSPASPPPSMAVSPRSIHFPTELTSAPALTRLPRDTLCPCSVGGQGLVISAARAHHLWTGGSGPLSSMGWAPQPLRPCARLPEHTAAGGPGSRRQQRGTPAAREASCRPGPAQKGGQPQNERASRRCTGKRRGQAAGCFGSNQTEPLGRYECLGKACGQLGPLSPSQHKHPGHLQGGCERLAVRCGSGQQPQLRQAQGVQQ